MQSIFYYAVFYPVIEVIGALASALIIWFGGGWAMEGSLTLGALVAFLQYSQRFFRPISDMSERFNVLQAAMASAERIFKLLDTPVKIDPGQLGRASTPAGIQASIVVRGQHETPRAARPGIAVVFDDVSFAYNDKDYVLRNVSFGIQPGERVGIVGATGAGKSTLINLLLRFYDVGSGQILVDGIDVRAWDVQALRAHFSLVLQDVHLFSGTVASNIRLGNAAITDDQVRRAARAVHADRFIDRFPDGYGHPVAERGATLSVGQKQLLSFARALAFDPAILVLDEATSSVDTVTELIIRDALKVLMAGRTTLAIAHRLSTIQDMDKILVLHRGELRETGSHQELLARRGITQSCISCSSKSRSGRQRSLRTEAASLALSSSELREDGMIELALPLVEEGRDSTLDDLLEMRRDAMCLERGLIGVMFVEQEQVGVLGGPVGVVNHAARFGGLDDWRHTAQRRLHFVAAACLYVVFRCQNDHAILQEGQRFLVISSKRGVARSAKPSFVRSMNSAARSSFVASAMPSSVPSTMSAVSNASARTASGSITVTDASRCVSGRPVRGSRMCAIR